MQYGVVDASDADVGAEAPGFRTTWHSKEDLREQLMEIDDVPKDGRLYFWDGELWLRWEALDDLPGPEEDPLRIMVVRPQNAGTLLCPGLIHLSACAHKISINTRFLWQVRLQVLNLRLVAYLPDAWQLQCSVS